MQNLELSRKHVSFLDVYCSIKAKPGLERQHTRYRDMFDDISQIVIGPTEHGHPLATPILLPNYTLIERTELYGVNKTHIPDRVISDLLVAVFMDADILLPTPREGEAQAPKHLFLKFASHPGQIGLDIQLEFPPEIALEITKGLRDYLPTELLKQVTTHYRVPRVA